MRNMERSVQLMNKDMAVSLYMRSGEDWEKACDSARILIKDREQRGQVIYWIIKLRDCLKERPL